MAKGSSARGRGDGSGQQVETLLHELIQKEEEIHLLQVSLQEERRQVDQLREAAYRQENKYRAHSADCEAQLVRLRSQVTRLSRSFEHLKEKRHHERQSSTSGPHLSEMREELERTKLNLQISNEELKKALARLGEKEGARTEAEKQEVVTRMMEEVSLDVERILEDKDNPIYIPLSSTPPQEPAEILSELINKHFAQLNNELTKILRPN